VAKSQNKRSRHHERYGAKHMIILRNHLVLLLAAACTFVFGALRAEGAGFHILHAFNDNGNAAIPFGSITLSNGVLYGTTTFSTYGEGDVTAVGGLGGGAIFSISPQGSDFQILKEFSIPEEGVHPYHGICVVGSTLFGTTRGGGLNEKGVLFSIRTDGSEYKVLHHFATPTGCNPLCGPIISGDLFGLTNLGGDNDAGVIYRYQIETGKYTVLHHLGFSTGAGESFGGKPFGSLTVVGDYLYGMASDHRATKSHGSIFRYHVPSGSFETVHSFEGSKNGGYPYDSLVYDGQEYLYGTTLGYYPFTGETEPLYDEGTVFRLSTKTFQFSTLHDFSLSREDGAKPNSAMSIGRDGLLYGIAHGTDCWGGKAFEPGTLFRLRPDGSKFEVLHQFNSAENGITPMRSIIMNGRSILGVTAFGGQGRGLGGGTVWRFDMPTFGNISIDGTTVLRLFITSLLACLTILAIFFRFRSKAAQGGVPNT
jgi:uncharacterized repeat protein (TIGR03803 family)